MKPTFLFAAKILAVISALTLAGFYVWNTQKTANDGYTIDLNLEPEVKDFEGFIKYGTPIQTEGTDALGKPVTIMLGSKSIPQPVFSTRKTTVSNTPPPQAVVDPNVQRRVNMLFYSLLDPPRPRPPHRRFMGGSKSGLIETSVNVFDFSPFFRQAK